METFEYDNLDRVEREHWYYSGKREIVRHWIDRLRPLSPSDTLLDFGAGSGLFASDFLSRCRVLVSDSYPESRAMLARRFSAETILDPSGGRIPVADGSVDVVTALDVLEHIENDAAAVDEVRRVLRASGLFVVTVPADPRLWSDWDVSLHHYRRYTRQGLLALFDASRWDVLHAAYTNVIAWPAVWLVRRMRARKKTNGGATARAEDRVPAAWLNGLLRFLFTAPARAPWMPAPWGVSLILVARKR